MRKGLFTVVLTVLLIVPLLVLADQKDSEQKVSDQTATSEDGTTVLQPINVVSQPIIEGNNIDAFGGQSTTISREQINALDAVDLSGALRTAPGVNITRYNNVGSFGGGEGGAVFIRGIGSSRPGGEIQTMIDDVPVYNGVWNHSLIDLVPISEASKIEIFKGSQPMRYGNGFGSINVVPLKREEAGFETHGKAGYGSYNTVEESLRTAGKVGRFDYSVGQQFAYSSGDRDNSDGRLFNVYAGGGAEITPHWNARVFGLFTDNNSNDPGQEGNPASREGTYKTRGGVASLTLANDYDVIKGYFKFYWSGGYGDWLNQAGNADDTNSDWSLGGAKVREQIAAWRGGEILLGMDVDFIGGDCDFIDDAGVFSHFDGPLFSIISGYTGISHTFGSREGWFLSPSAGVRGYSHSDFPSEVAPQAALVFGYKDTEAHVTYGRGVNYPGLNVVVFSQNVIPPLGNSWKDLKPEVVDHLEVGISQKIGSWATIDATYFYDHGRNRYVMVTTNPPPVFENIDSFTIHGVEMTVAVRPHETVSFFSGATYLHRSPSDLPYAPEWSYSGGLGWSIWRGLKLDVDAQYVSTMHAGSQARVSGAGNPRTVGAYFLLNAKAQYEFMVKSIGTTLTPYVAMQNITNADYEYQPGYPMPGINAIGGLSFSF